MLRRARQSALLSKEEGQLTFEKPDGPRPISDITSVYGWCEERNGWSVWLGSITFDRGVGQPAQDKSPITSDQISMLSVIC